MRPLVLALALLEAGPAAAGVHTVRCAVNEFNAGRIESRVEIVLLLDDEAKSVGFGGGEPTVVSRYTPDYVVGQGFGTGLVFHLDRSLGMYGATDINRPQWSAVGTCTADAAADR
jgi:hypothetical protein